MELLHLKYILVYLAQEGIHILPEAEALIYESMWVLGTSEAMPVPRATEPQRQCWNPKLQRLCSLPKPRWRYLSGTKDQNHRAPRTEDQKGNRNTHSMKIISDIGI